MVQIRGQVASRVDLLEVKEKNQTRKQLGEQAVLLSCSVRLFVFASPYAVCRQHDSVFQLGLGQLQPNLIPWVRVMF